MTEAAPRPWMFGGEFSTGDGRHLNAYCHANAALIVKAVNHHDALVSALEHLLDKSEKHIFGNECQTERDAARVILSQVRGERYEKQI